MNITDVFEKQKADREQKERDREERPAECIGRKHWWYYVSSYALKCKHCGALKVAGR